MWALNPMTSVLLYQENRDTDTQREYCVMTGGDWGDGSTAKEARDYEEPEARRQARKGSPPEFSIPASIMISDFWILSASRTVRE